MKTEQRQSDDQDARGTPQYPILVQRIQTKEDAEALWSECMQRDHSVLCVRERKEDKRGVFCKEHTTLGVYNPLREGGGLHGSGVFSRLQYGLQSFGISLALHPLGYEWEEDGSVHELVLDDISALRKKVAIALAGANVLVLEDTEDYVRNVVDGITKAQQEADVEAANICACNDVQTALNILDKQRSWQLAISDLNVFPEPDWLRSMPVGDEFMRAVAERGEIPLVSNSTPIPGIYGIGKDPLNNQLDMTKILRAHRGENPPICEYNNDRSS